LAAIARHGGRRGGGGPTTKCRHALPLRQLRASPVGGHIRGLPDKQTTPHPSTAPSRRKRRKAGCGADSDTDTDTGAAFATDPQPLETVAELSRTRVGFTTADLGADIMRKIEEVEKIASVSSNMKEALVRRLRLASRRTKASGAEFQQRTVDTSAAASTVAGLCRLRTRDGGVGDDDMRMDKSGGTETTDKDVGSNNSQERICGRGCALWRVRLVVSRRWWND
jgi:hypothetical protein